MHRAIAKEPPRVRTKDGERQRHRAVDMRDSETIRRRQDSANRILGMLMAALNLAVTEEKAPDGPWRYVKPFKNVARIEKKMHHVIEMWAPWMSAKERSAYVKHVWGLDLYERTPIAKELGDRLGLTNTEREALKLWPFLPIDKTKEELAEQAKVRERERRARKRREKGVRTREAYLAELAGRPKPWIVQGISRSAYYRKRTRDELSPRLRRGESEIIVFKQRTQVVSLKVGGLRKEGHQRGVSGESRKQITRQAKRAETKA